MPSIIDVEDMCTKAELVTFINVPTSQISGNDVTVQYKPGQHLKATAWDWVGVFPAERQKNSRPIAFQWAQVATPTTGGGRKRAGLRTVTFPADVFEKLSDDSQSYRYKYVNKAGEAMGQSSTFTVVSKVANTRGGSRKKRTQSKQGDALLDSDSETGTSHTSLVVVPSDSDWDFPASLPLEDHAEDHDSFTSELSDIVVLSTSPSKDAVLARQNAFAVLETLRSSSSEGFVLTGDEAEDDDDDNDSGVVTRTSGDDISILLLPEDDISQGSTTSKSQKKPKNLKGVDIPTADAETEDDFSLASTRSTKQQSVEKHENASTKSKSKKKKSKKKSKSDSNDESRDKTESLKELDIVDLRSPILKRKGKMSIQEKLRFVDSESEDEGIGYEKKQSLNKRLVEIITDEKEKCQPEMFVKSVQEFKKTKKLKKVEESKDSAVLDKCVGKRVKSKEINLETKNAPKILSEIEDQSCGIRKALNVRFDELSKSNEKTTQPNTRKEVPKFMSDLKIHVPSRSSLEKSVMSALKMENAKGSLKNAPAQISTQCVIKTKISPPKPDSDVNKQVVAPKKKKTEKKEEVILPSIKPFNVDSNLKEITESVLKTSTSARIKTLQNKKLSVAERMMKMKSLVKTDTVVTSVDPAATKTKGNKSTKKEANKSAMSGSEAKAAKKLNVYMYSGRRAANKLRKHREHNRNQQRVYNLVRLFGDCTNSEEDVEGAAQTMMTSTLLRDTTDAGFPNLPVSSRPLIPLLQASSVPVGMQDSGIDFDRFEHPESDPPSRLEECDDVIDDADILEASPDGADLFLWQRSLAPLLSKAALPHFKAKYKIKNAFKQRQYQKHPKLKQITNARNFVSSLVKGGIVQTRLDDTTEGRDKDLSASSCAPGCEQPTESVDESNTTPSDVTREPRSAAEKRTDKVYKNAVKLHKNKENARKKQMLCKARDKKANRQTPTVEDGGFDFSSFVATSRREEEEPKKKEEVEEVKDLVPFGPRYVDVFTGNAHKSEARAAIPLPWPTPVSPLFLGPPKYTLPSAAQGTSNMFSFLAPCSSTSEATICEIIDEEVKPSRKASRKKKFAAMMVKDRPAPQTCDLQLTEPRPRDFTPDDVMTDFGVLKVRSKTTKSKDVKRAKLEAKRGKCKQMMTYANVRALESELKTYQRTINSMDAHINSLKLALKLETKRAETKSRMDVQATTKRKCTTAVTSQKQEMTSLGVVYWQDVDVDLWGEPVCKKTRQSETATATSTATTQTTTSTTNTGTTTATATATATGSQHLSGTTSAPAGLLSGRTKSRHLCSGVPLQPWVYFDTDRDVAPSDVEPAGVPLAAPRVKGGDAKSKSSTATYHQERWFSPRSLPSLKFDECRYEDHRDDYPRPYEPLEPEWDTEVSQTTPLDLSEKRQYLQPPQSPHFIAPPVSRVKPCLAQQDAMSDVLGNRKMTECCQPGCTCPCCPKKSDCTYPCCPKKSGCTCPCCPKNSGCPCPCCPKKSGCTCPCRPKKSGCTCPCCPKTSDCTCPCCPKKSGCTCPCCPNQSDCTCPCCSKKSDCNCPCCPKRPGSTCPCCPKKSCCSDPCCPCPCCPPSCCPCEYKRDTTTNVWSPSIDTNTRYSVLDDQLMDNGEYPLGYQPYIWCGNLTHIDLLADDTPSTRNHFRFNEQPTDNLSANTHNQSMTFQPIKDSKAHAIFF